MITYGHKPVQLGRLPYRRQLCSADMTPTLHIHSTKAREIARDQVSPSCCTSILPVDSWSFTLASLLHGTITIALTPDCPRVAHDALHLLATWLSYMRVMTIVCLIIMMIVLTQWWVLIVGYSCQEQWCDFPSMMRIVARRSER